jgi:hypothetical protein
MSSCCLKVHPQIQVYSYIESKQPGKTFLSCKSAVIETNVSRSPSISKSNIEILTARPEAIPVAHLLEDPPTGRKPRISATKTDTKRSSSACAGITMLSVIETINSIVIAIFVAVVAFSCYRAYTLRLEHTTKHAASADRHEDRRQKRKERMMHGNYSSHIKIGGKARK